MIKIEEKKILFDEEAKRMFRHMKPVDFGSHADVYKIRIEGELYALKIYNGLYKESYEECERKLNIDIPSYVTPKKILYINNKFSGYAMKFVEGKNLMDIGILNISIDDFAKNASKLLSDTVEFSKTRYTLYDTFLTNIMYCKEGFKMIDTDDYKYEDNKSLEEIKKINSKRFNLLLIDIFIKSTGLNQEFQNDNLYKALKEDCISCVTPFEALFNYLCMKAYSSTDENIEKLQEVGKVLKKIK